jgi:NADH dehydrogenase FAD-containing subunit
LIQDGDGFEDVYLVKPIERLLEAQQRILTLGRQRKLSIGIVGGGPSAVEIAGNLWRLTQPAGMHPADIKILAGSTLMPDHVSGIRSRAEASLRKRGIEIVSNCRVRQIKSGEVTTDQGRRYALDIIFVAIGVKPTPVFKHSDLPVGPDGGLLVNRFLHSTAHATIFGGGDCIYFQDQPLDKVGVFAVRQNPVLFHNLMATLDGAALQPFDPGGKYLLIFNLGDGTGIFHKGALQFGGRLAFRIKDYIDRKFMRRFQQIEA